MADTNAPATDTPSAGTTGDAADLGAPPTGGAPSDDLGYPTQASVSQNDDTAATEDVTEEGTSEKKPSEKQGTLSDLAGKLSSWRGIGSGDSKEEEPTDATTGEEPDNEATVESPATPVLTPQPVNIGSPAASPTSFVGQAEQASDKEVEDESAGDIPPTTLPSTPGALDASANEVDTVSPMSLESPGESTSAPVAEGVQPASTPADIQEESYAEMPSSAQAALSSAKEAMEKISKARPEPKPPDSGGAAMVGPKSKEPEFGPWKTKQIEMPGSTEQEAARKSGRYPYSIADLLQTVVDKDASDLHVTVDYPAMIRIDGDLMPVGQELIGENDINDLVLPVLPENKRELLEVNREVDLAYSFKGDARFRINAFYTKGHVSAAFRLIPNKIRSVEELKLPGIYHQFAKLPQGFVLVTGPTGHGKSTTLAAIVQEINETYPKHIITIEDPIEYIFPRARALVDQREMHEDTHSWEIALRSAMREDPDVVLVGEMRDFETIQSAITLAETGHLVLATLHTNSAGQTIDRIIDVFPEHQQEQVRTQLSVILEGIVSQRLIPIKQGGRRAASEVLLATGAVRNLIREGKTHQIDNVIRTSLDVGMKTLEHSLVELVREGMISVEDAEANALHPEEVTRLMRGN